MQRIMVSLALKTTTQSIIVGKLSAYARKNKTRRTLWEYDNIIRSLYLLEYIDSPPLRRNAQRALTRIENYHQLRRAVSYANFGKLRFKTEGEQQLWNECSRFLTNCIIYYNAAILSNLLAYKEKSGDSQGTSLVKQVSPVAWQHINFYGRYEFTKGPEPVNMETRANRGLSRQQQFLGSGRSHAWRPAIEDISPVISHNLCPHLSQQMGASLRPPHRLFFDQAATDDLVPRRFPKCRRDRLSLAIAVTGVGDEEVIRPGQGKPSAARRLSFAWGQRLKQGAEKGGFSDFFGKCCRCLSSCSLSGAKSC